MGEHVPGEGATGPIGRRAVLQTLLTGAGATLALPAVAREHPIHDHLRDQARITAADQRASSARAPQYLDAHQFETLTLLAEQIVPGSTKAQSAAFIDALLTVETDARQKRFLEALSAFDGTALAKSKRPWKKLPEAERTALLTAASTAASGAPPPAGYIAPGTTPKPQGDVTLTMRDHFEHLKGWISGAYYSSDIGMQELGWTGSMFFESFPGCTHGSH